MPFDFLVAGELLVVSLQSFLAKRAISAESVLSVEYIPALGPLTPGAAPRHDDWVASLSGGWAAALVSGSYDGVARLWDTTGAPLAELRGHGGAVTAVAAAVAHGGDELCGEVLTASLDGTARLFRLHLPPPRRLGGGSPPPPLQAQAGAVLAGHSEGLQAVALSRDGSGCVTAGWDASLALWSMDKLRAACDAAAAAGPAPGGAPGGKRRKTSVRGAVAAAGDGAVPQVPEATLSGHTGCVSALSWPEATSLYSASWDHAIRRWFAPPPPPPAAARGAPKRAEAIPTPGLQGRGRGGVHTDAQCRGGQSHPLPLRAAGWPAAAGLWRRGSRGAGVGPARFVHGGQLCAELAHRLGLCGRLVPLERAPAAQRLVRWLGQGLGRARQGAAAHRRRFGREAVGGRLACRQRPEQLLAGRRWHGLPASHL